MAICFFIISSDDFLERAPDLVIGQPAFLSVHDVFNAWLKAFMSISMPRFFMSFANCMPMP